MKKNESFYVCMTLFLSGTEEVSSDDVDMIGIFKTKEACKELIEKVAAKDYPDVCFEWDDDTYSGTEEVDDDYSKMFYIIKEKVKR